MEISDRKILQAVIQQTEDLDKIVRRVDSMMVEGLETDRLETENGRFADDEGPGLSSECKSHQFYEGTLHVRKEDTQGSQKSTIGPCGKCHQKGHTRKYCQTRLEKATREQD